VVKWNTTTLQRDIANTTGINYLQMGITFTELFKQVSCSCSTIYMNSVISVTKMNNSQKFKLSTNEIQATEQVNRGNNFHIMCTAVT